ncbi:MAG: phosphoribosylformylglycinamidine synthase I [Dehalococcoidales bacterium]|nr:phosphoribosylformylglycinamidine synthase I [Dehalococcoidales bacterium]
MAKVKVLILRAPGTNCDVETAYAFQQAGAETSLVHINQLVRRRQKLADYQILVLPGGFTYGDDLGAGKVQANELRLKQGEEIKRFLESGGLILGICNGFQAMLKAGILPEPALVINNEVTLANNDSGKFECRWIRLAAEPKSNCIFTKGIERMYLPVAHGEGKIVAADGILDKLNIALYYIDEKGNRNTGYPHNPNGSLRSIAGIADSTGRVFALMPHPERYIRGTQHPQWTRLGAKSTGDGFRIFLNAVNWAKSL